MELSAAIIGDGLDLYRKILLRNHSHFPSTLSVHGISAAAIQPVDSSAAPRAAVRSDPYRPPAAAPRALVRRMRRIRRRSATEDGGEDGFSGDGDGDDGPFGGGGRGGGGRSWGSWGHEGSEWEDPDRRPWLSSSSDPAFDVVYEVVCWIALSNCAHFAFKKMTRLLAERDKDVSTRLVLRLLPIC